MYAFVQGGHAGAPVCLWDDVLLYLLTQRMQSIL